MPWHRVRPCSVPIRDMNVLVTGATGFIGSHVVRELLSGGHFVHAAVRPGASLHRLVNLPDGMTTWDADLGDGPAVARMVSQARPDALIHLAWYAEPGAYLRNVDHNLGSLEDSVRLLRLLAQGRPLRVVLAGTCLEAANGRHRMEEPIYAVAKRALHEVATHADAADWTVTCAHVFSVFGPWEHESRGVPSVIRALLDGDPVEVGDGTQLREYVHVTDVARAFVAIMEGDTGDTVDVCAGEPRPIGEVFDEIGRMTDRSHLIRREMRPTHPDERFDAVGDPGPLRALGWRPQKPFEDRMRETVAWWRSRSPTLSGSDSAG